MSFNLLDTAKNYFTPEFVNQASSRLGESNAGISKALSGIIPTELAGILRKATSDAEGANSIFNISKEAAGELPTSPDFSSLSSSQSKMGQADVLSRLFGEKKAGIATVISKFAGIKDSSASSLMNMGIPAIMGLVGKHAQQNNMSPSGLSGFLSSQKDQIMSAMPSGLSSLAGMAGLSGFTSTISSTTENIKSAATGSTKDVVRKTGSANWIWVLLLAVAAIALIWYFMQGRNKTSTTVPATESTVEATKDRSAVSTVPAATLPELIKVQLPNGKQLDAYKGGIEDQLVNFLSGDWRSMSDDALKAKWFNFDNLNFNTGSATLTAESQAQLNNIADVLKAFPDAKIKIGGYTGASGNASVNKKLSQDRANAAKSGLEKLGVGAQVIGAEGYGSEFAKYPATASEQDRATDRHVSVSVRK